MEKDLKKEKKEIKVVPGDGSELDISKVYDHLNVNGPSENAPEEGTIVIPPEKK